ncbi:MAG: hypothetical protein CM15mP74_36900 [Halieaceae bacterium]|nr:MAG: hypothetical protein CM15mP74_36900 [Halieaceae bacterium]
MDQKHCNWSSQISRARAGEVLIEVAYAALNPLDNHARAIASNGITRLPFTPGFEFCGVVDAASVRASMKPLIVNVWPPMVNGAAMRFCHRLAHSGRVPDEFVGPGGLFLPVPIPVGC